jgi:hypothetical protein
MKQRRGIFRLLALAAAGAAGVVAAGAAGPDWSINATIIEACSCPMFCQCYFEAKPASHAGHSGAEHFCKFNNAFKVNRGSYGATTLDGAKFWVAGDLGGDFASGQANWAVVTFDRTVTKEQRDGIAAILAHVYPVKWKSLTTAEAAMEWKHTGDTAVATLDGGKTAEVRLRKFPGMTSDPVVIKNLKYFGVPRNDGFIMMPNEVEAYRAGDRAFEFRNSNGFMITIDMSSADVAAARAALLR